MRSGLANGLVSPATQSYLARLGWHDHQSNVCRNSMERESESNEDIDLIQNNGIDDNNNDHNNNNNNNDNDHNNDNDNGNKSEKGVSKKDYFKFLIQQKEICQQQEKESQSNSNAKKSKKKTHWRGLYKFWSMRQSDAVTVLEDLEYVTMSMKQGLGFKDSQTSFVTFCAWFEANCQKLSISVNMQLFRSNCQSLKHFKTLKKGKKTKKQRQEKEQQMKNNNNNNIHNHSDVVENLKKMEMRRKKKPKMKIPKLPKAPALPNDPKLRALHKLRTNVEEKGGWMKVTMTEQKFIICGRLAIKGFIVKKQSVRDIVCPEIEKLDIHWAYSSLCNFGATSTKFVKYSNDNGGSYLFKFNDNERKILESIPLPQALSQWISGWNDNKIEEQKKNYSFKSKYHFQKHKNEKKKSDIGQSNDDSDYCDDDDCDDSDDSDHSDDESFDFSKPILGKRQKPECDEKKEETDADVRAKNDKYWNKFKKPRI